MRQPRAAAGQVVGGRVGAARAGLGELPPERVVAEADDVAGDLGAGQPAEEIVAVGDRVLVVGRALEYFVMAMESRGLGDPILHHLILWSMCTLSTAIWSASLRRQSLEATLPR